MLAVLAGVLVVGLLGGYLRLRSYVHSEEFRRFLAEQVGRALKMKGQFEPFQWDGLQVRTGGFAANGEGLMAAISADDLRTEIGLGGVRRGVWELLGSSVRRVELTLDARSKRVEAAPEEVPAPDPAAAAPVASPAAKRRGWLPDQIESKELRVDESVLRVRLDGGEVVAAGQHWLVVPGGVKGSYNLDAAGGTVVHPWKSFPELHLQRARMRVQDQHLFLTNADAAIFDKGLLSAAGEAGFADGDYSFECGLEGVRCDEVLPEDWKQRLRGQVSSDFTISGHRGELQVSGKVKVKDGVLTALPVLDRLAAYADTTRFRVMNLQEARANFTRSGDHLTLTEIVISSEGLLRLEGLLDVKGRQLDGHFRLGLAPGTLARIPGAETKVFSAGERGLLWAPLRITGTIDEPQEDLSERLVNAAGERMFELIPETGEKVLKFTRSLFGDEGRDQGRSAVDEVKQQGSDLLQGAGDVVRGVGGFFNLLPRGDKQPK